jgi:hypothetical protein
VLHKISNDCEHAVISGLIGEGAAGEFLAFRRLFAQLPSVDPIIKNPSKCDLPEDPSVKHALIGALVDKLKGADKSTLNAITIVFGRLGPEFAVCGIKQSIALGHRVDQTDAGKSWLLKHRSLIV